MVNDRIEQLIEYFCEGNKSLFAKKIGVAPSVIGNITGERKGNPSFEVTQKILDAFVTVDPDWFIHGTGSMLRSDQSTLQNSASISDNSFVYRLYKDLEAKADRLLEENGALKHEVRRLEADWEGEKFVPSVSTERKSKRGSGVSSQPSAKSGKSETKNKEI